MELCCAKKPMLASGEGRSPAPPMPSWETQGPGAATHMDFGFANALQQDNNLQFLGLESRKESSP
jgi:hypothetical protein